MDLLKTIVDSMRNAATNAGVPIVTGDTKVVDKGKADALFVNTAGIGVVIAPTAIGPDSVHSVDAVLVSGDLGAHGIAVLSVRGGLEFEGEVKSDTAAVWPTVEALLDARIEVHCLRDLTRGGLSSALNEIAFVAGLHFAIEEAQIPVSDAVRGACEILGLGPLYVANEGRFVAFVPEQMRSMHSRSCARRRFRLVRHASAQCEQLRQGLLPSAAESAAIACLICCLENSCRESVRAGQIGYGNRLDPETQLA
jgi:hydrogenase expression/formation protein HypE